MLHILNENISILKIFVYDHFLSFKQKFIELRRARKETIKMDACNNNSEMAQPNFVDVLEALKDLPTCGILSQDGYGGMVYLALAADWISKALDVLEDYGYYWCNMDPFGAIIPIVSEEEAVDHEVKKIPGLGSVVEFKVVKAFPFRPQIRIDGVEKWSEYLIKVESAELEKIRKDLTGLPPQDLGFCINVGVRIEDMLDLTDEFGSTSTQLACGCGCPISCEPCRYELCLRVGMMLELVRLEEGEEEEEEEEGKEEA